MSGNKLFNNFIAERLELIKQNSAALDDTNLIVELLTSDIYDLVSSYYNMTDNQKLYIKETIKNVKKHQL